ncbi:DUF4440 domain-containing protein [Desulfosporosinus fructosivorans]|uniref:DUF4440 domain-containing protein n=1 Tax=Desulfosporosinus fructosivorans TaxID=2018669 RepID=A0A4Z0RBR0_9FIRM|nr:DUF4440 domain-containing protein [Desulfosporosinus fructosivorans]TGE39433.1 DUF4440 domain-containing protein [Desulfosporosinus fructosivorans]
MVSSLYEQIYDLEDRLLQPEIRGSREEISMLLADDFVESGVSGRTFDKLQVVEELPHSPAVPVIIKDFQVKVLSPDVVLATYRAVKTNEFREEMRNSLRSSIWKFLDGRWQMVFHQGTRTINNIRVDES